MLLRYAPIAALVAGGVGALACSSLSDPSQGTVAKSDLGNVGQSDSPVVGTKVSGNLPGVPASAHVALVWRNHNALVVANDAPFDASGNFSMQVVAPPDSYLDVIDPTEQAWGGANDAWWDAGARSPVQGASPVLAAFAGFVVYQDTNGNGQLDLDPTSGVTADTIVGGSSGAGTTLLQTLCYFAGGSDSDYEQMHATNAEDPRSSVTTPKPGLNLFTNLQGWAAGLDAILLTFAGTEVLGGTVCGPVPNNNATESAFLSHGYSNYPPTQTITCSPDGHIFTTTDPDWIPQVCIPMNQGNPGVCAFNTANPAGELNQTICAIPMQPESDAGPNDPPQAWLHGLPAGQPLPAGWPCLADGGVASTSDAGAH